MEGLDNRAERISEVRYDIELFDARRDGDFYQPDKLVYRKENLSEASHQLERPLEPCRRYFWTARAWFKLDGWPRVTEWTGAYGALGLARLWEYRRLEASRTPRPGEGSALERLFPPGIDMSNPRFHYLPFRTPAGSGASCE